MTEEIIIDGVNVAGCCCYENGKCLWTKRYYENNIVPDCENVKNCYYKQLKRAEIEIEKLKGVDGSVHPDSAYYKITRLEQENKRLEFELKITKADYEASEQENKELKEENYSLNNELLGYKKGVMAAENIQYRNAFEEIREAVKTNLDAGILISGGWIEQKIDEVLNPHN